MRKCKTCGTALWMCFFITGFPWQKRINKIKDAEDCIDLLTLKDDAKIRQEVERELSALSKHSKPTT